MRLTTYTDYTLRVLMYLTLKYKSGEKATIQEIAQSYDISRNHLMKIVHELAQRGIVETTRGRAGGVWLARPPREITVGEIVRMAEPDMVIAQCHQPGQERACAAWKACNLSRAFNRALAAFLRELDQMTLEDAVSPQPAAAAYLGLGSDGRKVIPLAVASPPRKTAPPRPAPRPARARSAAPAAAPRSGGARRKA
jgi:Rrf2 family nitric oxide-sensitive transcriptional repressor